MHIGQHQHTASFFYFWAKSSAPNYHFVSSNKKKKIMNCLGRPRKVCGPDQPVLAQTRSRHRHIFLCICMGPANDVRCLVGGTGSYHSYQRLLSGTTLIRMRSGDLNISIKNQVLVLICSFLLYFWGSGIIFVCMYWCSNLYLVYNLFQISIAYFLAPICCLI